MNNEHPSDPAASSDFGRLFVQFEPRIHGFIRSLVADRHEAEEILQDTASVMWRKFDEFRPGTDFLAWALAVARYRVKEHRRRRRQALSFDEAFVDAIAEDTVALQSRLNDLHDALAACLGKLKPRDHELFQRRYSADISVSDLAAQLGRPISTVYNTLARIRRALLDCVSRKVLGDEGFAGRAEA
jgi:RNA polymerase sigma-70 factor (ECF subfamily)